MLWYMPAALSGGSCIVGRGLRRAWGELHGGLLAKGPPPSLGGWWEAAGLAGLGREQGRPSLAGHSSWLWAALERPGSKQEKEEKHHVESGQGLDSRSRGQGTSGVSVGSRGPCCFWSIAQLLVFWSRHVCMLSSGPWWGLTAWPAVTPGLPLWWALLGGGGPEGALHLWS